MLSGPNRSPMLLRMVGPNLNEPSVLAGDLYSTCVYFKMVRHPSL